MSMFRKIGLVACAFLILFSSCNSSQRASKKRRKQAPCDCPKFNDVPHKNNTYKVYELDITDVMNDLKA